jgi:hypothetical protein
MSIILTTTMASVLGQSGRGREMSRRRKATTLGGDRRSRRRTSASGGGRRWRRCAAATVTRESRERNGTWGPCCIPLRPDRFSGGFSGLARSKPAYKTITDVFLRVSDWTKNLHSQTGQNTPTKHSSWLRLPSFQLIFQILSEATLHQLLPESRF